MYTRNARTREFETQVEAQETARTHQARWRERRDSHAVFTAIKEGEVFVVRRVIYRGRRYFETFLSDDGRYRDPFPCNR